MTITEVTKMVNEVIETGMKMGMLEIECVVRRADGTIKSTETVKKPVRVAFDQSGEQIVSVQEYAQIDEQIAKGG
jgi:hypothetical protein